MVRDYPAAVQVAKLPKSRYLPSSVGSDPVAAVCAAWLILALPGGVNAGQWRIEPHLQISETYTDNVALASPGQERNDFITQINPGISIRGLTGRSEAQLDYMMTNLIYTKDSDRNAVNHQLSAGAKTELVSDLLFFNASAGVSQQNVSLLGPIGIDFTNQNQNTTEVRTYVLSPLIRDNFGSTFSYEARYQRDHVSTDNNGLADSDADKIFVSVKSGTAFNRFGWGLSYVREQVDYRNSQDTNSDKVTGDIRYAFTPHFGVLGTVGYENNDYLYIGEKPRGDFWSAGIFWQPSRLTSLTLTAGERFFGKTKALDFSHRSRRILWSARYSEDISSTRSNFLLPTAFNTFSALDKLASSNPTYQALTSAERATAINSLIEGSRLPPTLFGATNFVTNRTFLQKRFDGSVTFNTSKTTYFFNMFMDSRDAQTIGAVSNFLATDDFNSSNNVRQKGADFVVTWQFAPKTGVNLDVGGSEVNFRDSGREDRFRFVRLGVRHQLQSKISGSVDVRHVERDSNAANADYKENAVSAALNIRF